MSYPLVEVEFKQPVAMSQSSITIDGLDVTNMVRRMEMDITAGDLIVLKLHIPARLRMKLPAVLEIFVVEDTEKLPAEGDA